MKKFLLSALSLMCFAFTVNAQTELSSFTNTGHGGATTFATDYQCTGINPANLGWAWKYDTRKCALGFNEMTASIHSEALQKNELRDFIKQSISGNFNDFTRQQKLDAAKNFTSTGFAINIDYGLCGFGFTTKHAGGFAFRVSDRFQWYSQLGAQASDLLFMGKTSSYFDSLQYIIPSGQMNAGDTVNIANYANMSPDSVANVLAGYASAAVAKKMGQVMNGSEITMSWTREWNVSYGRRIFGDSVFALFGGIGVKYVQGTGYMSIKSENDKLTAISSLSPGFNVDYGTAQAAANSVSGSGFPPKTVGSGFGFDFGLNCIIANKLKIGASIINMGSITWKGNVYQVRDTFLFKTMNPGMNNYNLPGNLKDMIGQNGFMELVGQKEIKTQLPSMGRFGASFMIKKRAELGFDMIFPFNSVAGSFNKPLIGFGGDVLPCKWLKLQAGFMTGGNYKFSIPVGIIFITKDGGFEAGVASRDAITFFTQNGPTISLSTGFMRFRF
ncbi:MAG: hypothetical protein IAF38_06370 [Bacteroidia bacterium]|nr:hypothetical protein [Bacteroidia bacterium]